MYKKKIIAGYTLLVAGSVTLICVVVFAVLGYRFLAQPDVEFEEDQTWSQSENASEKISIPGFETWSIDAGSTKAVTNFYNPESNSCYFVIRVVLDETGETLYESKYMKPGQHLYEVELQKAMEAGSYAATLHYSAYSSVDMTPLNGADIPFKLVVK